ncbi:SGNH/GDSL hydrolase family protein [Sorangium cellulosum]|uniref:GDSL family lipase n=1 Tax=Sorangium cellulosum TaxID=56 RepID=A0A150PZ23_SORCE|nr:SGNH/GDSL hydrolase family protein [Sorangium cellulosum]KYF60930.1 GDSL family lipase [Sorangium cellulosum]
MRKILWALLFLSVAACGDDTSGSPTSTSSSGSTAASGSTGAPTTTSGTTGPGSTGHGGGGEGGVSGTGGAGGATGTGGAPGEGGGGGTPGERRWVGTWTTGPQLTETNNNPPAPGLGNNTLRQVVYTSIGGSNVRLLLSNEFGDGPVTMQSVHIADSTTDDGIDASTDHALTFSGAESVTIPVGKAVFSDPIDYNLKPVSKLAVTIRFGTVPAGITGHPGSRTTSYIQTGDGVSSATLTSPVKTDHWYYITGLDVMADPTAAAVVILGDSITDGRGSTTNGNNRWPDFLSRRLRTNMGTENVAVLNLGIGGNNVLSGGLGPTAKARFQRDVLEQRGARWLVIFEGVNDIGTSAAGTGPTVADGLISAFGEFIDKAHDKGMLVYGVPILPFNGHDYYTTEREAARQEVNEWIRTSGEFDAVIDLDAAVRDPNDPSKLQDSLDFDDWLHLNPTGLETMAKAVDLSLFTK